MEGILWAGLTARSRSRVFAGGLTWWSGGSVAWWRRRCGCGREWWSQCCAPRWLRGNASGAGGRGRAVVEAQSRSLQWGRANERASARLTSE